jgi:hypothetical protein
VITDLDEAAPPLAALPPGTPVSPESQAAAFEAFSRMA